MKLKHGAVIGALAAITLGASAVPAAAQLVTRCTGDFGGISVPGDLVVPAGRSCNLDGATINGNVRVAADADLVGTDIEVAGNVIVQGNGYFDAADSTVEGNVRLNGAFGGFLEDSNVGGNVISNTAGFAYVIGGHVDANLRAVEGELFVEDALVHGDVVARDTEFADFYGATVEGDATVNGSAAGTIWCASWVDGDVRVVNNSEVVQIGAETPFQGCGFNVFDGDVHIANNTAQVVVSNNAIRGNLSGNGNDPAPTGSDNRVRGTVSGQFLDLAPEDDDLAATQVMARSAAVDAEAEQRYAETRAVVDSKRAAAAKL